jgi:hypothetical protein
VSKEKLHNDMSQEEREKEARKYVESQSPVVPEPIVTLNKFGEHVPEEAPKKESSK